MNMKKAINRKPWSDADVKGVLKLYNSFLHSQFDGEKYVKAPAVRALAEKQDRTKGSIEAKMMNVSAVLQMHGRAFVTGYKPLPNINKALIGQVAQFYGFEPKS